MNVGLRISTRAIGLDLDLVAEEIGCQECKGSLHKTYWYIGQILYICHCCGVYYDRREIEKLNKARGGSHVRNTYRVHDQQDGRETLHILCGRSEQLPESEGARSDGDERDSQLSLW